MPWQGPVPNQGHPNRPPPRGKPRAGQPSRSIRLSSPAAMAPVRMASAKKSPMPPLTSALRARTLTTRWPASAPPNSQAPARKRQPHQQAAEKGARHVALQLGIQLEMAAPVERKAQHADIEPGGKGGRERNADIAHELEQGVGADGVDHEADHGEAKRGCRIFARVKSRRQRLDQHDRRAGRSYRRSRPRTWRRRHAHRRRRAHRARRRSDREWRSALPSPAGSAAGRIRCCGSGCLAQHLRRARAAPGPVPAAAPRRRPNRSPPAAADRSGRRNKDRRRRPAGWWRPWCRPED